MTPCDEKGKEYTEMDDMYVDSPEELIGRQLNFKIKIINCRGLPNKYTVRRIIFMIIRMMIKNVFYIRICIADIVSIWTKKTLLLVMFPCPATQITTMKKFTSLTQ